jgi:hypothetical protein
MQYPRLQEMPLGEGTLARELRAVFGSPNLSGRYFECNSNLILIA